MIDAFKNKLNKPSDVYLDTPNIEFEKINSEGESAPSKISRAKIHGGWLVWGFNIGMSNGGGLCFVPDENHEWSLETPRQKSDKANQ
ncbi:hypothetical protein [Vibrio fluvialis]|uniref:hypothetical protein n=1 Tax=Vibrio fluvialis TaxID=676 RepID=UPI002573E38A|nr:hypothetical protein [Vibrio fluvialis]BEI26620.1 hypothetical protein KKIDH5335_49520 [Vibrio fluvialis]